MRNLKHKKGSSEIFLDDAQAMLTKGFSIYDVPDAVLSARETAFDLAAHNDSTVRKQAETIIAVLSKCVIAIGADDVGKLAT